jgi:YVTN family beta-propeller protein
MTLTLMMTVVVAADAATVSNAWSAKVGSGGANGTATIQAYTSGTGAIALRLARLKPATYLPVTLSKGTCSSVGSTLIKFPAIKTTSTGAAARTSSLTASQVTLIENATAGGGRIAIRVGSSTTGGVKCGLFAVLVIPPYVAANVSVGRYPSGIATTPSGVLVANWVDGTLSRIDPATNTVLASLPVTVSGIEGPHAVAYGEGAVWVTMYALDSSGKDSIAGAVERLDPVSGVVLATIPVGKAPFGIATSPGAVWVANYDDGTISRIDPATNQVTASITLSAGVYGLAFDFGSLWATNEQTGTVSRIDPATNQVTTTIPTVGGPEGVTSGAGALWVANWGTTGQADGTLSRIDPATNQVVRAIPVGTNPSDVAFGGGSVWVAMVGEPAVVQVNSATNAVQARIGMGAKVLDSTGDVVGLRGITATDHAAWVVRPLPYPDANTAAPAGSAIRINY